MADERARFRACWAVLVEGLNINPAEAERRWLLDAEWHAMAFEKLQWITAGYGLGAKESEFLMGLADQLAITSEERLAQECDRYGLPHDLDSLLRHIYGNHALIVGAKDYTIAALDEKLQGRAATSAFEEGVFEGYNRALADAVEAGAGGGEQVGWVLFDGDEYHDFRYTNPSDHRASVVGKGYLPVFVAALRTTKEGEPWTAPRPDPALIGVINKGYKSPKRAAKEGKDGT